ncbi:MAG: NADH-quinone oxidoreductase subunit C [Coriobacteriia bacterium]|nr:NADH-quinone oxidoreductase subunit C [Coriobacteriia bacterium]
MKPAMLTEQVTAALDAAGITQHQVSEWEHLGVVARVPADAVVGVLDVLRQHEELQFVQLIDTFGADLSDLIEVTYRLRSLKHNVDLLVKCELPYGASYSSVGTVFASALLPERELCEMFGLVLSGHPNPKRLLTIEGMPPFLRKDVAIRTKEEIWG